MKLLLQTKKPNLHQRKDTEVSDFTSDMNLKNGGHLQTGIWEAEKHKQNGLSYQAVAYMRETESSYLHCWLSYKVGRNADHYTVCFMQSV